jgi:type IV pilus assembly protein PilM
MALSLRKNSDGGTVGLDIDGRFIAAAQVQDGRLTNLVSAELSAGILADGEVTDRAALAEALKRFVSENGLPRRVQLGVSNQQIVVRVLELPRIDDESERDAALRFQAAEAIAMPLDEAVLDHQVAGYVTNADGAERMQVVVVAARRTMIEEYLAAVKDAGLKAEGIDLDAFALVRMLADEARASLELPATAELSVDPAAAETAEIAEQPATPVEEDPPPSARVLCHLGGVSNLAIAVGSSCFFTRTLSTPFDVDGAGARLADEIRMSIDYYMAQPAALAVGDVLLSGEGARDAVLVAEVGAQLGLPVAAARPLGGLDSSTVPHADDPHRYTVAAGLALGAAA